MLIASHYVVKDLLLVFQSGKAEEIKKSCKMFSDRYKDDKELVALCNQALEAIEKNKKFAEDKKFKDVEAKFKELEQTRVTADATGHGLWYSDRRSV
jgi:hypothetical protein